jgi:hypothetical protein
MDHLVNFFSGLLSPHARGVFYDDASNGYGAYGMVTGEGKYLSWSSFVHHTTFVSFLA